MSLRFANFATTIVLVTLFFFEITATTLASDYEVDPTVKTMEDFSGHSIHEPRSFISNTLSSLSVESQSLQNQIDELSRLSDTPVPSVTRILYTEKFEEIRFIKNLMGLSGLSVREDAVGNIFGRWEGYRPGLPALATGSHIDAIPYSGKYDGVVGVLGAIEAINVLKRSGFEPKRSLEVILFTSEEPTRFGISCLGSRLLAGSESLAKALKTTVDAQNTSFFDAARSAGYANDQDDLSSVFLKKGFYSAFVELHIEQGPILEEEGISIGVVTAIAAPASIKVEFEGNGGHAGAVLMPKRNDAGLAAAELALAVERHVLESGSIDSVGTVGILELHPGAINSIPSKSHIEIDTRDIDEERRNTIIEKICQSATAIAERRWVKLSAFNIVNQDPPVLSDKLIIQAMEAASKELNLTHKSMISRAYHDSLFMARFIKNLMGLSGLSVREDAVGNIFGRWEGYRPGLPALATGSHIDAIPYTGKYDGVVGVLGAIEAINVLKRSGFKPKRSLEVILFTSEESVALEGSESLAKALKTTVDGQNTSFFDAARSAGYANDQDDLSSVFLKKGFYSAFVELHIEQGPILEEEGISIGVVTAIAAPASIKVEFEGNGGHAGAVLMPMRNDAGLAAAELALAVERHVLESGSIDSVGTVGILELHPGAINSIPSKSRIEIDTRDIDEERRNTIIEKIRQSATAIAEKRQVKLSAFNIVNQDPPALSDKSIIQAMEAASKELNLTHKSMISRAYHDSLFMARVSPMGMIFIPCYKGYSHKPEEFSSIEDISNGVKVLAITLAKLSLE